jgi:hypothetical protein
MTRIYKRLYREGEIVDLKEAVRLLDGDPSLRERS